jgi:hypothetical protein
VPLGSTQGERFHPGIWDVAPTSGVPSLVLFTCSDPSTMSFPSSFHLPELHGVEWCPHGSGRGGLVDPGGDSRRSLAQLMETREQQSETLDSWAPRRTHPSSLWLLLATKDTLQPRMQSMNSHRWFQSWCDITQSFHLYGTLCLMVETPGPHKFMYLLCFVQFFVVVFFNRSKLSILYLF